MVTVSPTQEAVPSVHLDKLTRLIGKLLTKTQKTKVKLTEQATVKMFLAFFFWRFEGGREDVALG